MSLKSKRKSDLLLKKVLINNSFKAMNPDIDLIRDFIVLVSELRRFTISYLTLHQNPTLIGVNELTTGLAQTLATNDPNAPKIVATHLTERYRVIYRRYIRNNINELRGEEWQPIAAEQVVVEVRDMIDVFLGLNPTFLTDQPVVPYVSHNSSESLSDKCLKNASIDCNQSLSQI